MKHTKVITLSLVFLVLLVASVFWYVYGNAHITTPEKENQVSNTTEIPDINNASTTKEKISTKDWQTCRNEKAGYVFKYPEGWYTFGEGSMSEHTPVVVRETPCVGYSVLVSSIYRASREHKPQEPEGNMGVGTKIPEFRKGSIHEGDRSIEDHLESRPAFKYQRIEKNMIDGEDALIDSDGDILVYHGDRSYSIYFDTYQSDVISPALQQAMLSTFRFLD